ncbi:MAG: organic hydroperoxide resistance protein [Pseudomonadales bacterium]|nr:organic hydroperoxide resistance protein [Pseudomonadales bacterium]
MQILYKTQATATGGRQGQVRTADGVLDMRLALPRELGGPGHAHSNPEQLFAAGFAACFDNALTHVASQRKLRLQGTVVTAHIGLGSLEQGGFGLTARLDIHIPGVSTSEAQELIEATEKVCPYTNAIRGNVPLELVLI